MDTARLLIVDDDSRLRDLLQKYLIQEGFNVSTVANAKGMEQMLAREHIDLMVLDLTLPGEDGLSICRRLRGNGIKTPIVMLTAKGDEIDRIVGLEIGADDYLAKPCNPRELLARIRAVLRRQTTAIPGAPKPDGELIRFGMFSLDRSARLLRRKDKTLKLTSGEFALLSVLASHPHQPLSRDHLLNLARGRDYDAFDRSVDVTISRLRRLLEIDPRDPRIIQTIWGHGYVFVPEEAPS